MKYICCLWLFWISGYITHAQSADDWYAFYNASEDLVGFKDASGKVMIRPRYNGFGIAKKFTDIMVMSEEINERYTTFYLLKNGKKLGLDSIYITDNTPDCEYNGFIRFQDSKTEKVGLFNRKGEVSVPAAYNWLSRVDNGILIALKDARKEYWDKEHDDGCNHYSYVGGTYSIIDTSNRILVQNVIETPIDMYAYTVEAYPSKDSTKVSFPDINGKYYIFEHKEKVFARWFHEQLLSDLSMSNLIARSFPVICYQDKQEAFVYKPSAAFFKDNQKDIAYLFGLFAASGADYFITEDHFLNIPDSFEYSFDHCYNNCGEWISSRYPLFSVIINEHKSQDDFSQHHLSFIRTEDGYKLLSIYIRDKGLL